MTEELTEAKPAARPLRLAGRFLRRSWQGIVVGVLAIALGVAAYLSPGLVQADVHLDEGMVYVAKRDIGMAGMVNVQIDEISDGAPVGGEAFDILQYEDRVFVHGVESDLLSQYFPGRNVVSPPTRLPPNAQLQLVGETLLVVNPVNGRAWFGPAETVLDYDFDKEKAHLEVGENGTATLTTKGDVIGLNVENSELVRLTDTGQTATSLPFELGTDLINIQISAVGDNAVVLDRATNRIWAEGLDAAVEVDGGATAELMAPAPDALGGEEGARAIYSTQATLIALTSDGPQSLADQMSAAPVAPVQVGNCVYAAFGDQFVKRCRGEEAQVRTIEELAPGAQLRFQVNRTTVALNDVTNGYVWLVDKDMTLVRNWDRVLPADAEQTSELLERDNVLPPDRDEPNRPPTAADDHLFARAGRSTILNVLDNDNDPDGDVLTISTLGDPEGATLQQVRDGAGLQITLGANAPQVVTFPYTIDDGHGHQASANVTVNVLPADPTEANEAPHLYNQEVVRLSQRQTITKRVLLDWRDREGDPMYLKAASLPAGSEDVLRFTSDGTLTFIDVGKTLGRKTVKLVVSDGVDDREGEITFDVTDEIVPPIAYGDFVITTVGKKVTVNPTLNDLGEPWLSEATTECAEPVCKLDVNNRGDDTVEFTAHRAGTYYVRYTVTNGSVAEGLIRIDVKTEATDNPPVPALDVAFLPAGGSVLIDPLLNDSDPDGDVLVIQSISQHPSLEIVLERRHLVTIRARVTPTEPITLNYRVSDGKHVAIDCSNVGPDSVPCGTIIVVPTPPTSGLLTPEAEDDEVSVRAGATAVADVLVNDESPLGLDLELTEILANPFGEDRAWIDDGRIRVSVPPGAAEGSTFLDYEITDANGRTASATLEVDVISEDASNEPPVPRAIVDRVLAGTVSRIPINLAGIDPNGDAVRLLGIASGPTRGRVLEVGEDYLTYEAFEANQGTDSFLYAVTDSHGAEGIGEIRIGVAPAHPENAAPTALTDTVRVRPGRHVQFDPFENDFDVDGDALDFAADNPVVIEEGGIVAEAVDREISLTAPMEPGSYVGSYNIVDSRLAASSGAFEIVVDPEAPLLAPVVRDDTVPIAAIANEDWPEVDVFANDYDPDGRVEDLTLEVPPTSDDPALSARVTDDGRRVTVPVGDVMQQIRYIAVDPDGNRSVGLIVMPGRNDSVPVLADPTDVRQATAGQPTTFNLNPLVLGTNGRQVRLRSGDSISATFGSAKPAGPASIEYVPDVNYQGPASVVFEVADEARDDESWDRRAFISVPFEVRPAPNRATGAEDEDNPTTNVAPEPIVGNPTLRVAPGEGPARLDLQALFRDPEGQSFFVHDSITHVAGDAELQPYIQDRYLVAEAGIRARQGSSVTVRGVVEDAQGATREFDVRVEVIPSTKPTITTRDDTAEGIAGEPVEVNVTGNDESHLSDKTIELLPQVNVVGGNATARANPASGTVTVTPTAGQHGLVTVQYVVVDATGDPARQVEGRVLVNVRAEPAKPVGPMNVVEDDSFITFEYDLEHTGGFPESDLTAVAWATSTGRSDVRGTCSGKKCTVTGLQNGIGWSVYVVVTNPIGSAESGRSVAVVPDSKPKAPNPPTVEFGDKQLTINWAPNGWENEVYGGSPINGYTLSGYDVTNKRALTVGGQTALRLDGVGNTSYTWTGLTNGNVYTFQVMAHSSSGLESGLSGASAPEYPSGPPIGEVNPTVEPHQNEIGGGFRVHFPTSAINNNGATIEGYWVQPVFDGGGTGEMIPATVSADGATASAEAYDLGIRGTRFMVFAKNRSSGTSPTHVGTSNPSKIAYPLPKIESLSHTVGDGQVTLLVTSNLDGHPVSIEYNVNGGSWRALGSDGIVSGLTNGQSYTISVRAQIEGMPVSEPATINNVVPRSTDPIGPARSDISYTLANDRSVTLRIPSQTWVETGGWDPDYFRFCIDPSGGCRRFVSDRVFNRTPGDYNFAWFYDDGNTRYVNPSTSISIARISTPSYSRNSGTLSFSFPYVNEGVCTVRDAGNDHLITTLNHTQYGTFSASNLSVTYETGGTETEPPTTVVPDNVRVSCTINGWSETY